MKQQLSFTHAELSQQARRTRREVFLTEMDGLIPWAEFIELIEPFYGTHTRGRPPIGAERMLRLYFVQCWFTLSDEATEEALYDSVAVSRFVGIDLGRERAPDATTLLRFRHLLQEHGLNETLFGELNRRLGERGLLMRAGTIADATLIAAPSSTKNQDQARDPEMHQTKKGNQWYFGMKAHIGADVESGLVHTVVTTPANASDVSVVQELLHGEEASLHGDAGYQLGPERTQALAERKVKPFIAAKRGTIKKLLEGSPLRALLEHIEHLKASVRAKVEHAFGIVKNRFGFRKTRYRGLAKNHAHLHTLFMLANLVIAKKKLQHLHTLNPS